MRNRIKKCIKFFRAMYSIKEYINYLKRVEGFSNKVGDRFYPYDSPEGGLKTIGYGYKIKSEEEQESLEKDGLSSTEVEKLLEDEAIKSYEIAKKFCNQKNIDWDKIDNRLQYALSDYIFNVGSLKKFPTTVKCLTEGNIQGAVADDKGRPGFKEYERTYRDANGERKRLGRNDEFYKEFLEPYLV